MPVNFDFITTVLVHHLEVVTFPYIYTFFWSFIEQMLQWWVGGILNTGLSHHCQAFIHRMQSSFDILSYGLDKQLSVGPWMNTAKGVEAHHRFT